MSSSDVSLGENEDRCRFNGDLSSESDNSSLDEINDKQGFLMFRSSAEPDLGALPSGSTKKPQLLMTNANQFSNNCAQVHKSKKKKKRKNNRARRQWIVALVPRCYPLNTLDKKQADMIEEKLIEKLDSIQAGAGLEPVFDGWCFRSGAFIITCDSEPSKDWISNLAPELIVNPTTVLIASGPEILLKNIPGRAYFPGKFFTPDLVLSMLIRENTLKDIRMWSLTQFQKLPNGFWGNLGIPVTSIPELQAKGFKVYFNREEVNIKVFGLDKIISKETQYS